MKYSREMEYDSQLFMLDQSLAELKLAYDLIDDFVEEPGKYDTLSIIEILRERFCNVLFMLKEIKQ